MERLTLGQARIVSGVVEVLQRGEWLPASDSIKNCQAAADSTGQIIVGQDLAIYIVDTQPDAQYLINQVSELTALVSTLGNTLVDKGGIPGIPLDAVTAAAADALQLELDEKELI